MLLSKFVFGSFSFICFERAIYFTLLVILQHFASFIYWAVSSKGAFTEVARVIEAQILVQLID